ncbi:glycosyltransferase [Caenimonas koreensis DSM 17982]|uniref:Glycosyltransferase n=1 Tax=Caenimonas koreensis DSM 17982 TaxID=1121255 RepID=A0A844B0M7_9BURK|nr:glycosyltransferase [Caenimonas koreensis]MRD46842.1 glycosyltransferase [Caenimonas koreensis DSM 17982]
MAISPGLEPISIVIPTYMRDQVLVDTLVHLLRLERRAAEILVVDQSASHDAATAGQLQRMHDAGDIRWVRLTVPSIPQAMNKGLVLASQPFVLFLDDDIIPDEGLAAQHVLAHREHPDIIVAGRVIQPWQEGTTPPEAEPFSFFGTHPRWISEFMGGNFSLSRELAIRLGGFDENFVRVAYRFEAEFAHRFIKSGHRIRFTPAACIHHLKVAAGGTRMYGEHLTTWRPDHAVGAYYFGLRTGSAGEFVSRPLRSVVTRYHLRHPWRIPATLLSEFSAMVWAMMLYAKGPKFVEPEPGQ